MKRNIAVCLPVAPHDIDMAMELAKLWAEMEPTFNKDAIIIIALRFDMTVEQVPVAVVDLLKTKFFQVHVIVSPLVGTGFPHGCNALEIGAYQWFVERARANEITADYMFIAESDSVPTRTTWIREIMDEAYDNQVNIMGIWWSKDEGFPHINGNCVIHKDFWRVCREIWQIPPTNGWDCFIGKTSLAIGKASRLMWQDYHLGWPENPWEGDDYIFESRKYVGPNNPLYGETLHPAFIHGTKTYQGIDAVRKRYGLPRRK